MQAGSRTEAKAPLPYESSFPALGHSSGPPSPSAATHQPWASGWGSPASAALKQSLSHPPLQLQQSQQRPPAPSARVPQVAPPAKFPEPQVQGAAAVPWVETGAAVSREYGEAREEARDYARARNVYFEQVRQQLGGPVVRPFS